MFAKPLRQYYSAFLLSILVLSSIMIAQAPLAHAGGGWSGAQRLTSSQSVYPDIVIDSQGVQHIVYTESDFVSRYIVRYINNRSGQWSDPVTLSPSGFRAELPRLSTITIQGRVYLALVYKARLGNNANSRIYYQLSTDGGVTWGSPEQITSSTSFEPAVVLDPSGQPHVAFSQGPGDTLNLAYITKVNGTWTSPVTLSSSSTSFNRDTTIGYTVANGQLTLHVIYMGRIGTDENGKQIYYTRKIGSGGWSAPIQRQSIGGGGYPKLVTDHSSSIYGAWQMGRADVGAYGVEIYTEQSADNGTTWTSARAVGSLNKYIAQTPAIARTPGGALAVAWEDGTSSSDDTRDIEARVSTDNGATWSGVQNVSPADGLSRNPAMDGDSAGFKLVWHDVRTTKYQIYYSTYSVGPSAPTAQPVINTPTTKGPSVSVSFTNVGGGANQIRWKWGAAPTDTANDSNGWQTFTNPTSIALPTVTSTGSCQNLVLYTQVRNASVVQNGASSVSVKYDGAAQANVIVSNPYLNGLPATFTQRVQDTYNTATDGAYNGNPNYTRVPQFYLAINNNNDCSGLTSFLIPATNTSGSLTTGSYVKIISMPQGSFPNPGTKVRIDVVVSDGIGNITSYPKDIIYDPANTAQSGTPNTDGLPTYKGGSATVSTDNSILRTLTFQNVSVNDTVYGQFENLPAGSQFWGVWIANSTTPVNNPNSSGLQWFPVEVRNPSSNFTVSWNLFNGIAPANRKPGTYYIYIKFLDGAGNATVGTVPAVQATLAQGYKVPTLYLPHVRK